MLDEMSDTNKHAAALAAKPQITITFKERLADGDEYIYVATNPQLQGCVAQGDTLEEALENLSEVRVYWYEHVLEHGLPLPDIDVPESTSTKARFRLSSEQLVEEVKSPKYKVLEFA